MNQTVSERQPVLKHKKTIASLTIFALASVALGLIFSFVQCSPYSNSCEFWVEFPGVIQFLGYLITLAPSVLLLVYILKYFRKRSGSVLMPFVFGIIALLPFVDTIQSVFYGWGLYFPEELIDYLFFFSFGLATYCALTGFSKKIVFAISLIIGMLIEVYWTYQFIDKFIYALEEYFDWKNVLYDTYYLFTWIVPLVARIGRIAFYAALLLFGVKNEIPAILSEGISSIQAALQNKKTPNRMDSKTELQALKNKFELGLLTQEEYNAKRAEIIKKL